MGLQVWLPLNKDTRNVGLTDVNVTNNGAVLTTGGIYTNCYSFNGVDNNLSFTPQVDGLSTISISLWLCPSSNNPSGAFFSLERETYWQVTMYYNNVGIRDDSIGYSGSRKDFSVGNYTANTWTHLAIVYDRGTLKIYRDGALLSTNSVGGTKLNTGINGGRIGSAVQPDYYYSGKINDVRIYDHALSEEDVKRIYNCKIMDICASSYNGGFFYDNSGLLINDLVSTGLTFSGNSMYFNGSTTQIRPKDGTSGLNISGGTLSVWFTPLSKPSDFRIVYIDSKSKMALGFYSGNYFIVVTSEADNKSTFSNDSLIYNQLNNVIISYDQSYNPLYCYVNGVKAATASINSWTETSGLTIGGRQYNTANKFNGYISKVTVYRNQLTEDEAKQLYAIGPQDKILPDEYIRLEYLEATGTQWINTGLKTTSEYLRIITKLKVSECISNLRPFGSQKDTQCTIVPWPNNNTNPYGWLAVGTDYFTQTTGSNYFTTPLNKDFYMDIVANSGTVKGIYCGYNLNATYTGSLQNGYDIYVFASNRNGTPQIGGTQRIYYFQMFLSENYLSFCGIPAKRKSDNVVGLYDIVTKTFFTNAGSGYFIAGPAI